MSTGTIFIIIGAIGALVMVILFAMFIRQIGKKRFENFNASLSYRQYQANQMSREPISMANMVFSESRKWHEGKGVPGGVRSVNSISLYDSSSNYEVATGFSCDQEATEKLSEK